MSDELVLTEQRGRVLILTLNRPDAMNSVNPALAQAVADALEAFDANDTAQVGVLTGAGRGFSAGMDLKAFADGAFPNIEGRGFGGIAEKSSVKPLVAAVEGFALAGGLEIALSCDVLVAAEGAKLGIPEVTVGLFAGAGALLRLPRQLPYNVAMEMALTGDPITAERGFELGMVNRVAPKGEAVAVAVELAERMAKNAPLGMAASKRIIREMGGMTEEQFWAYQGPIMSDVFGSSDAIEGATAFAEKRDPSWKGR